MCELFSHPVQQLLMSLSDATRLHPSASRFTLQMDGDVFTLQVDCARELQLLTNAQILRPCALSGRRVCVNEWVCSEREGVVGG